MQLCEKGAVMSERKKLDSVHTVVHRAVGYYAALLPMLIIVASVLTNIPSAITRVNSLLKRDEKGVAIVEIILILMILIGIVFGVMKLLGGAVSNAGNTTSSCITNPTGSQCG